VSFRQGGAGKRRDANEKPIVEALRGLGCEITYLGGLGCPDLLVRAPGASGRWIPLEVKTPKGRMQPSQQRIAWPVVRSVDEAIAAVFG
jgi:hypothetical protein